MSKLFDRNFNYLSIHYTINRVLKCTTKKNNWNAYNKQWIAKYGIPPTSFITDASFLFLFFFTFPLIVCSYVVNNILISKLWVGSIEGTTLILYFPGSLTNKLCFLHNIFSQIILRLISFQIFRCIYTCYLTLCNQILTHPHNVRGPESTCDRGFVSGPSATTGLRPDPWRCEDDFDFNLEIHLPHKIGRHCRYSFSQHLIRSLLSVQY